MEGCTCNRTEQAAPIKNEIFDSVQTLLRLLNDIEKKKNIAQRTCKGYHDMFKPCSHSDNEIEGDEVKKDKTEPIPTDEDQLSAAEKAELEVVNKLLSKAERAYKVKEKLAEPKRPQNKDGNIFPLKPEKPDQEESRNHVENSCKTQSEETKTVSDKSDQILGSEVKPKNAKQTHNYKNKNQPLDSESNKVLNKNIPTRSKLDGKKPQKSSLPHIKAPFQTNPSIPFPKKSTSITKSAPHVRPSSASRYRQTSKNSPNQPVSKEMSQRKGQGQQKVETSPKQIENNRSEKEDISGLKESLDIKLKQHEENSCHSYNDIEHKHFDDQEYVNKKKTESGRLTADSNKENSRKSSENCVIQEVVQLETVDHKSPEKKKFNLLTDGSNIPLPAKLRKYAANNKRLKQKYDMYKVTKKVNGVYAAEKIKTAIEMSFTDIEEWTLTKTIQDMTNIYTNLRKYLESLDLPHISDSSSVYEILRCRKSLEQILSTFHIVEEQRSQLNTNCLNNADYIGTWRVDVTKPHVEKPNIWLPVLTKDTWLPDPPEVLQYRSIRQLEQYSNLLFQLQYCQFQSYLHEVFAKEILPFLKSVHPKSSEFISLLRSSFSLLTDDETFPVIVRDTIQELEESITDNVS